MKPLAKYGPMAKSRLLQFIYYALIMQFIPEKTCKDKRVMLIFLPLKKVRKGKDMLGYERI